MTIITKYNSTGIPNVKNVEKNPGCVLRLHKMSWPPGLYPETAMGSLQHSAVFSYKLSCYNCYFLSASLPFTREYVISWQKINK